MNELALFAGAGGGILGSHLLGWNTICAVERDAYAAQVLAQRQNDGILPPFPIWSDVCSFDGKRWRGIIDVISGGFPCQDISSAGKGAGIDGAKSGMWAEMARIIGEVRPRFVYVENSPMLVGRGLTRVIGDLTKMGYDAQWARFSASNFGAPHERDRLWIATYANCQGLSIEDFPSRLQKKFTRARNNGSEMANAQSIRLEQARECECRSAQRTTGRGNEFSNTDSIGCEQMEQSNSSGASSEGLASTAKHCSFTTRREWWATEPRLGRVADGVANRVDRLKAIGNGQVPIVAKSAFEYLGVSNA